MLRKQSTILGATNSNCQETSTGTADCSLYSRVNKRTITGVSRRRLLRFTD